MKKNKTRWVVKSVQHVERNGAVITLYAAHGRTFDCHDLDQKWPQAK